MVCVYIEFIQRMGKEWGRLSLIYRHSPSTQIYYTGFQRQSQFASMVLNFRSLFRPALFLLSPSLSLPPSLSPCISCPCISPSLHLSLSLPPSLTLCLSLSVRPSVCLFLDLFSLFLSLPLCLCLCLSVYVCLSVRLSVSLCISLFLSFSLCLCLCAFVSVCLFVRPALCLYLSLSQFLPFIISGSFNLFVSFLSLYDNISCSLALSLSVSLCLSLCPSLSLSLSLCPS